MSKVCQLRKMVFSCTLLPSKIYNFIVCKIRRVSYGQGLKINGRIFIRGKGKITIGDNVTINSSLESNPIGGSVRTIMHCISGDIFIGNNVGISNAALVAREKITIGNWVKIGGGVKIYDNDFHSCNYL